VPLLVSFCSCWRPNNSSQCHVNRYVDAKKKTLAKNVRHPIRLSAGIPELLTKVCESLRERGEQPKVLGCLGLQLRAVSLRQNKCLVERQNCTLCQVVQTWRCWALLMRHISRLSCVFCLLWDMPRYCGRDLTLSCRGVRVVATLTLRRRVRTQS